MIGWKTVPQTLSCFVRDNAIFQTMWRVWPAANNSFTVQKLWRLFTKHWLSFWLRSFFWSRYFLFQRCELQQVGNSGPRHPGIPDESHRIEGEEFTIHGPWRTFYFMDLALHRPFNLVNKNIKVTFCAIKTNVGFLDRRHNGVDSWSSSILL